MRARKAAVRGRRTKGTTAAAGAYEIVVVKAAGTGTAGMSGMSLGMGAIVVPR
ncbi:hypothetical protein [Streptomyces cavernae]|uniref:hypothetical protein n=1 Tax=Streptomyces cavernae TaxID=2259034 RepID=UPI0012D8F546|nr:hypothetical protein [Streptomyces cavernae]